MHTWNQQEIQPLQQHKSTIKLISRKLAPRAQPQEHVREQQSTQTSTEQIKHNKHLQ